MYEDMALEGLLDGPDQTHLAPEHFPIALEDRGIGDRWRAVLSELGGAMVLSIDDALKLYDDYRGPISTKAPEWDVAIAARVIDADRLDDLSTRRALRLADDRRVTVPLEGEARRLVQRADPSSLASTLGVSQVLHPAYFADSADAGTVTVALKAAGALADDCDQAISTLALLAASSASNAEERHPLRLSDSQLVALRDAWERLSVEQQGILGTQVGEAIELRVVYHGPKGHEEHGWASPTDAYLPSAIDKETASFAKAAGKTLGLAWIDSDYAKLLKRSGGRRELGAQRFLTAIGAAMDGPPQQTNEVRVTSLPRPPRSCFLSKRPRPSEARRPLLQRGDDDGSDGLAN